MALSNADIFARAWRDTVDHFKGGIASILPHGLFFVVGFLLYWWIRGLDSAMEELYVMVAFILAPFGLFAIGMFVWNLAYASDRIMLEELKKQPEPSFYDVSDVEVRKLIERAKNNIDNLDILVNVERFKNPVKFNLKTVDRNIQFSMTVFNNTIFDIIINSCNIKFHYINEELSTIPQMREQDKIIKHNSKETVYLNMSVSDSLHEVINENGRDAFLSQLVCVGKINYSFFDLLGNKHDRSLNIPLDYFSK